MENDILYSRYLGWMYKKMQVELLFPISKSYRKLFEYLHKIEFEYTIPMDVNRLEDGLELRHRFAFEEGIDTKDIDFSFGAIPCSVLEMMVALAIKMDEEILYDYEKGDRSGMWFYEMIENLGLAYEDDYDISYEYIDRVIDRFLSRRYLPSGDGGLFTVYNSYVDMREEEIWRQMCFYADTVC